MQRIQFFGDCGDDALWEAAPLDQKLATYAVQVKCTGLLNVLFIFVPITFLHIFNCL
jgi:hypothetical protein